MAKGKLRNCAGTEMTVEDTPLGTIVSMVHELQTPLATIISVGENIRDGLLEDRDRLREDGSVIVAHATKLMNLWDQILLYASTGRPGHRLNIRALTAGEVIDSALDNVSVLLRHNGFTVEKEIQAGIPLLRGDLQLLSQSLDNLIANAVKYSGQSRWVGITARRCRCSTSGREEICITVCDRGLGISAGDLPHIFEPFFRSRRPAFSKIRGSGMGLSIAKGCVEACGGLLSVVTQEDVGTIFTLHLPPHEGPPEESPESKSFARASQLGAPKDS